MTQHFVRLKMTERLSADNGEFWLHVISHLFNLTLLDVVLQATSQVIPKHDTFVAALQATGMMPLCLGISLLFW